ncbi:MAG TPA: nuclear transport factor 2 family protein [Chthoniobacterales bacterium]|nr:nuclear transport factor 2 family protein [Chthoniobacterales bacterium]
MKKYFSLAVTALLATVAVSLAGPDKAAVEAKEKAAWQSFKDKDAAAFQKVVDKDIKCVYDTGIADMQKELADMKTADLKSFAISDFTIFTDEPDVIVATYTVKLEGSSGGHDMTGTYNAGTVWKQEGGDWLAIFHTHSKQAAK